MPPKPKKQKTRPYQIHALTPVLRAAAGDVNRRKMPFLAASQWAQAVAEQLGGALTATQATRLHLAERKIARLSAVYRWVEPKLITDGGLALVNAKRRQPYALADYLDRTEDSLLRLLASLEATKVEKPVQDLSTYIAEKYGPKKRRPRRAKETKAVKVVKVAPDAPAAVAPETCAVEPRGAGATTDHADDGGPVPTADHGVEGQQGST